MRSGDVVLIDVDREDMQKQFIQEVIVDKINYWDKEVFKDEKCREAMESLGFSILSHLDGCATNDVQYCIAPYSVIWTEGGEEGHIVPHGVECDRLPGAVTFIADNNICGDLHDMYYPLMKGELE